LLQVITTRVATLIQDYNPQNVANTLWSFATLGVYPDPSLLDMLANRAVELIKVRSILHQTPVHLPFISIVHCALISTGFIASGASNHHKAPACGGLAILEG